MWLQRAVHIETRLHRLTLSDSRSGLRFMALECHCYYAHDGLAVVGFFGFEPTAECLVALREHHRLRLLRAIVVWDDDDIFMFITAVAAVANVAATCSPH